jgi:hypothetical protein
MSDIRSKADEALTTAKTKAIHAKDAAKDSAGKAAKQAVETVESNPIVALVGGLAIGAIAAALLPRTAREDKTLGGIGTTVRNTASNAVKAAKTAGMGQLDTLGITTGAAKDQFRDIVKKIGQAAATASSAAGETLRKR